MRKIWASPRKKEGTYESRSRPPVPARRRDSARDPHRRSFRGRRRTPRAKRQTQARREEAHPRATRAPGIPRASRLHRTDGTDRPDRAGRQGRRSWSVRRDQGALPRRRGFGLAPDVLHGAGLRARGCVQSLPGTYPLDGERRTRRAVGGRQPGDARPVLRHGRRLRQWRRHQSLSRGEQTRGHRDARPDHARGSGCHLRLRHRLRLGRRRLRRRRHDLAGPVKPGQSLPSHWYVDPGRLDDELERVFDRSWQYAGPAELVAEPGSFLTTRAGRVPIVVTRDTDGELNAFANVCRHRGAEVARERNGRRKSLQCHYHAWTYGLDGRLRAAPRTEGLDLDDVALPCATVGTWGPFVFVNPDPEAAPLAETLGELPTIVAEAGLPLDVVRPRRNAGYEIQANWKLVVDNYLECYHCPVAHPGFSQAFDLDDYTLTQYPTFSVQRTPGREAGEGLYAFLWPNFTINVYPGPGNVSVNLF